MKDKAKQILYNKSKTIPILSFPSVQLLGISVRELLESAETQVEGMKAIKERCNIGASLNMMDLSVEAEAFGAEIVFYDRDVPTVRKGIIDDIADAGSITVPSVYSGRAEICINGIKLAKEEIKDIPVLCGVIGPYSLAGRLFDMTELMMECYDSPEEVKILLSKATEFIIEYIKAFKKAGADGVILAEPAAGLLSPGLNAEFSVPFVKEIFDSVNDEDFIVCYHNCGNAVKDMTKEIGTLEADIYHFGNAVELKNIIPTMPEDSIVMGNIDPVLFKNGTPEDIRNSVRKLFDECSAYENFMISSGCDIPAEAKWENIDAYFEKVTELCV
ncbi:MAG: uroporphyrinogen decarboxylase family protein [Clostridia bacterium]|nr:uroporphyrinogen decarboxylase family protein [Clostridia bacterium]